MNLQTYLLYLTVVIVATASPGPAVILAMTNSFRFGLKKTIIAILGNITGLFVMGVISIAGLGAIIVTSATLFNIIKILGGLYLIYIGINMWRSKNSVTFSEDMEIKNQKNLWKLYKQAFFVAISNPKAIVFLIALFPQFIDSHESFVMQFAILISTLMFFSFAFLVFYATLAKQIKAKLTSPKHLKIFNRISGSIFIGFGSALALTSQK